VTTRTALLEVDDVSTTFRTKHGDLQAVVHVSLTLSPGETLGLVGESGSGKSVLGKTIMGLVANDRSTAVSGSIVFGEHDTQALTRKQQQELWGDDIAMVFQDPMSSLNPFKKVGTHLTETVRTHRGLDKSEARDRAIELLRKVRIPEPARRFEQYPHELSGGMRQRVVIAMALACDPSLVIADEPTTALDVTIQRQILDLLESLRAETDMAVILVSHDLGVVAGQTDRVAVMYAGRIVETGPTKQLFSSPRHPYTIALLSSVPKLEDPPHTRLVSIGGGLPDMTKPAPGCAFAPRCPRARQICSVATPQLTIAMPDSTASGVTPPSTSASSAPERVTHTHEVACHFPVDITPVAGSTSHSDSSAHPGVARGPVHNSESKAETE